MNPGLDAPPPAGEAHHRYAARLFQLHQQREQLRGQDRVLGWSKVVCALLTVAAGIWLARAHADLLALALFPAAAFATLWVTHERVLGRSRATTRLISFHEAGLARLDDRWAGTGDDGLRYLDPAHPYARDLDLFGRGSLFELLCQAVTAPGQQTLAQWLLHAAELPEIGARQAAVRELATRTDLRERLALAAERERTGDTEALNAWAETTASSVPPLLRSLALPLAMVWLVAVVVWAALGWQAPLLVTSALNLALTYRYRTQVMRGAAAAEHATQGLASKARVLTVFEAEAFVSPRLTHITDSLRVRGHVPSLAVTRLQRCMQWLESSDNWFVRLLDLFVFWTPMCMMAIERWRREYGTHVHAWQRALGDFEALCSLATFCFERSHASFPRCIAQGPALQAAGLIHPLLPYNRAVPNDVHLDASHALVMISGPNMAGKSTLLRAIGLNVVLAQSGAPACASSLELSPLAIGASITVQDSLQSGLSRFYAEIQRLKQVDELAHGANPALFLLDELLSGTNSHDRRVGTEALLRGLLGHNAVGLVTTHDLALTEIVGTLGDRAANMHFGDQFVDGSLIFDYKMTPGIANSTNALQLMRSVGLDV